MVVRRRKRSNKKRGGRTQHGNTKNWRGAGSRGGRGLAGGHKHKYSKYYSKFGTKIRFAPKSGPQKAINLDTLNQLIPKWLARKQVTQDKDGKIVIDGEKVGIDKVLGSGALEFEVEFKNIELSEKARSKLEGTEFESTQRAGE